MSKTPPVPEDQQSDIIKGQSSPPDRSAKVKHDPAGGTADLNLDSQGEGGNRAQNLPRQQQDR